MQKQKLIEYFTYFVVIAFLFGLLFSESVLSISSVLLLLLALLNGRFKDKIQFVKREKTIWAFAAIYLFYVVGMFFTNDFQLGLWELKRYLFWATIPLSVALIPNVDEKKVWNLLLVYVVMVFLATVHTGSRIVFSDYFQIDNVRYAAKIPHVSLSIQVVFAIFILLISKIIKTPVLGQINKWIVAGLILWLFAFLGFQKSLNAVLAFYVTGIIFIVWFFKRNNFPKVVWLLLLFYVLSPFAYVGNVAFHFFNFKEKKPDYSLKTESGRSYTFQTDKYETENGYHVYWYICNAELFSEWNRISDVKIDGIGASGEKIYDTLLRYMTSKGLKKDSVGIVSLNSTDIKNIQSGIANTIFVKHKYSIYPRIYETIWEINKYMHTGNPNNQSFSQRIEYFKATLYIVKNNFWGIGTGNFKSAFDDAFVKIDSKLKPELRNYVHNQYLNYLVKFGFLGFLLIIGLLSMTLFKKNQFKNVLSIVLISIVGVTCMGETTLETHIGLHFFLFFISVFMYHSPKLLVNSFIKNE
ncbi:MAG TPA: O-antigen ligase family protein [Prolixibacteraceae bacterium]|nr:O-antigen ligase family protein [Prolixibacteraceae bacterium]HPR60733.1 O-antigen ligase family protein [Prolixibacteraceae bacterium]